MKTKKEHLISSHNSLVIGKRETLVANDLSKIYKYLILQCQILRCIQRQGNATFTKFIKSGFMVLKQPFIAELTEYAKSLLYTKPFVPNQSYKH